MHLILVNNQEKGFSLMDLLVVVVVIGVLATMHLTAGVSSRGQSTAVVCRENLRQLTSAWRLYADDNGDHLTGNLDGSDAQNPTRPARSWCSGWFEYGTDRPSGASTNVELLRNGQLGPYVADVRIFKCPADMSVAVIGGRAYPRVRSVSMNSYMGQRSSPYSTGYRQFKTLAEVVQPPPSQAFVFLDEREDSIADGCFMIDMSGFDPAQPERAFMVRWPADYHDRGANLSFVDGHTETWRWRDPRTTPVHLRDARLAGCSQPFNVDLERIQNAATRKIDNPTR